MHLWDQLGLAAHAEAAQLLQNLDRMRLATIIEAADTPVTAKVMLAKIATMLLGIQLGAADVDNLQLVNASSQPVAHVQTVQVPVFTPAIQPVVNAIVAEPVVEKLAEEHSATAEVVNVQHITPEPTPEQLEKSEYVMALQRLLEFERSRLHDSNQHSDLLKCKMEELFAEINQKDSELESLKAQLQLSVLEHKRLDGASLKYLFELRNKRLKNLSEIRNEVVGVVTAYNQQAAASDKKLIIQPEELAITSALARVDSEIEREEKIQENVRRALQEQQKGPETEKLESDWYHF
jgi:hypothetical protein